jgi:alanine racemase
MGMEAITAGQLAEIVGGDLVSEGYGDRTVGDVAVDSRRVARGVAFFALAGARRDGHDFVEEALEHGAAVAVVARAWRSRATREGALVAVDSPLVALQRLATWWRSRFQGTVVGITGSNGKTIVKDALFGVLAETRSCAASPGSFNSQLGVPLAILQMSRYAEIALVEAGAADPGDMRAIAPIVAPDCAILTNVGMAHISAFGTREAIAKEKALLLDAVPASGWALAPAVEPLLAPVLERLRCRVYRFGAPSDEIPHVERYAPYRDGLKLEVRFPGGELRSIAIDTPSLHIARDVEIVVCAAHLLGVEPDAICAAFEEFTPASTKLEIWKAPTGVTVVNDSYSSDPISVRAALNTLASIRQTTGDRVFVFGGMRGLGRFERQEHEQVGALAAEAGVGRLVLVGDGMLEGTRDAFRKQVPLGEVTVAATVADVKERLLGTLKSGDVVLVKGPRNMGIDDVAREIVEAMAPSRFRVDLEAIHRNVSQYRRLLGPSTRVLAMVKALAYGSDATRLGVELQRMGVDWMGVAHADEGITLRKSGVTLPILVMMCTADEADKVVHFDLTPVVYSFEIVEPLAAAARSRGVTIDVHIEVDSGLGRMGVLPEATLDLARTIAATGSLRLSGVMTHFASADDPSADDFTRGQITRFRDVLADLEQAGFRGLMCHAAATSAAARFPEARFDMVRIGLGLYGVYPSPAVAEAIDLDLAVSLSSRIVEVRTLAKGHRIGYGGTFEVPEDGFRAGVVPLGYHDGIPWNLSNRGTVLVNGVQARILGRISMDSMVVDLSSLPDVEEGADVLIFGTRDGFVLRPEAVAEQSGTIAYELLARLGPRVQRVFSGRYEYQSERR